MTKKEYEAAEVRICDLYRNTELNRREIAGIMGMTGSEVGTIVSRHHAVKDYGDNGKFRHPEDYTPCMLSLKSWPRCYGYGCYGKDECMAYNAMQVRHG